MKKHLQYGVKVALLAACLLSLSSVPTANAVETGGLGGRPANPSKENSRTSSIFVYRLNQSETKNDAIEIFNNSSTSKDVMVYATDATTGSGGSFACKQRAEDKTNVGSWIKVSDKVTKLAPGESKKIDFSVAVPESAPAGEQNGCIAIEDISQTPTQTGNGVSISTRSAIRVSVTVPGSINKGLDILSLSATQSDKLKIATSLRNNGNVSLDTDLSVSLRSLIGSEISTVGGTFPVLSGVQSDYNFETVRPFWGGYYVLTASAAYNDSKDSVLGIGKKNTQVTTQTSLFIAPSLIAAVIELAAAASVVFGLVVVYRRRQTAKAWRNSASEYTVKPGDDIQSIATSYGISWKLLARQNNLKPPYHLSTGTKLHVLRATKKQSKQTKKKR